MNKLDLNIIQLPSDNFGQDLKNPRYIILHCIGYPEEKALTLLRKNTNEGGAGVSSHYFIPPLSAKEATKERGR
ncbi:MAG: hypothetical protein LEGION0398_MBIBDBAK_00873 [Legionellaceae bacterium]